MSDLKCLACGGTKFLTRSLLMSTASATFFGLDWLNPTVAAYICEQCGYVMLYSQNALKQEEELHDDPVMLEEERKRAIESFRARSR